MRMVAGVQPVPLPTLPDFSSAARKACLRNGSSPASRSQATALRPLTPPASFATTSVSRSAIGFPDKIVGVNLCLRSLLGRSDGPAVDRHALANPCDPRLCKGRALNRDEIGIGEPQRGASLYRREPVADHQPSPDFR